jgi:hypothetical protein
MGAMLNFGSGRWSPLRKIPKQDDYPILPNPTDPANQGEEADIQENYGEVPGRLTDQGDRPQTISKGARHSE